MSDTPHKLSTLLQVIVGLLLAVVLLAVALLSLRDHLRPWFLRVISDQKPVPETPPAQFERFRREQQDIAGAGNRGPILCSLSPWSEGGEHPPDLRLALTNTFAEPVTLWYHTWLHAHVTFLVRDQDGKAVASFHWGTLSSLAVGVDPQTGRPSTPVPTRTLKPGETYTAGIHLSSLRDYLSVPPGRYRVEAVFVYGDMGGWPAPDQDFVARSEGVEIAVEQDDDKKPVWRLARLIRKKDQAAAKK
jgi:hypothetical protein